MKPILKLSFRSLMVKPWRTVLTLLSVTLSVALVVMVCCFASTVMYCVDLTLESDEEAMQKQDGTDIIEDFSAEQVQQGSDQDEQDAFRTLMLGFVLLTAALAAMMIYSAFCVSFDGKTRTLGAITALGASGMQKACTVLTEAGLYALIGMPIGFVIGYFLAIPVSEPFIVSFVELAQTESFGIQLTPSWVITALLTALLAIFAAAYVPMRRAARVSVVDSIKRGESVDVNLRKKFITEVMEKFFGRLGLLAGQNYYNHRKKYRGLSFSLSGSCIFTIAVYSFAVYSSQTKVRVNDYITQGPRDMETFMIVWGTLRYLTLVLFLLSFLISAGCAIINMNRREQEFALLKGLGLSNGDLYKMMEIECIYMTVYMVLYAFIGSFAFNGLIYIYFPAAFHMTCFYEFPILLFLALCGICIGVAIFFALYSVFRIRKVNLADAMRNAT